MSSHNIKWFTESPLFSVSVKTTGKNYIVVLQAAKGNKIFLFNLFTVLQWVCVCVAALKAIITEGTLHNMWCRPVCSPGSWSRGGWFPPILAWHSKVMGLSCIKFKAVLEMSWTFMDSYLKCLNWIEIESMLFQRNSWNKLIIEMKDVSHFLIPCIFHSPTTPSTTPQSL